jgi:two-component system, OmpR family, alkaline phosphatase synthesis response regulator PhoP
MLYPEMRVLVIDDEHDVLMMCRVNLEFEGHQVLEASDGEEGLRLAAKARPDVIVLDLMLPQQDGFSVLARLQQDAETRRIPVILLTAKTAEEDQVRGWRAGADEYVTKPFSPTALNDAVAQIGRLSEQERASRRKRHLERLTIMRHL